DGGGRRPRRTGNAAGGAGGKPARRDRDRGAYRRGFRLPLGRGEPGVTEDRTTGGAPGPAGTLVCVVALAAMTAAACLVAARLYAGWQMPLVLAGAAGASVLLTGLLRWLSGTTAIAVLGSVAGLGASLTGLTAA